MVGAVYLTAAILLDFVFLSYVDDAVSRLANGFYILYSNDPHLAAIGFVWTPLTSIADLFPLLFKGLWPALATHMMAGSIVTIVSMAGAVHQMRCALLEWGLRRPARLTLTLLFAFNPMLIFFAANGMSEALLVFALVATTRYLLRWVRAGDLRSLVYAAPALAFGYLARNETILAAVVSSAFVLWVSFKKESGDRRQRVMIALTDMVIYLAPFVVSIVGWLTISYVIVGDAFEQFTANSSQIHETGFKPGTLTNRLVHEFSAIEHLVPLLPLIIVTALVVAWRRHDSQVFAPLVVLGGALAFDLLAYAGGELFPWFRFYILSIPIAVLLLGYALAPAPGPPVRFEKDNTWGTRPQRTSSPRWGLRAFAAAAVGFVILAPSIPATAIGMLDTNVGVGETSNYLGFIFHRNLTTEDRGAKDHHAKIMAIDAYIADLHLPNGSVIVDNTVQCIPDVIITSSNARVFVIPNDREFQRTLADPLTFHANYLLAPIGSGFPDFIDSAYPDLGATNNGVTKPIHTFSAGGLCPELKLYRVIGHPTAGGTTR